MTNRSAVEVPLQEFEHGLVDFTALTPQLLRAIMDDDIAYARDRWAQIAGATGPATVENTIEPLELSRSRLIRGYSLLSSLTNSVTTPELDELEAQVAGEFAAVFDELTLDRGIYDRVKALGPLQDDPESAWIRERFLRDAEHAGVSLEPEAQQRVREINQRIATLNVTFGQLVVAGMKHAQLWISADEAKALGTSGAAAAKAAGAAQSSSAPGESGDPGVAGGADHLITFELPTIQQTLESCTDRQLRRLIHEASIRRGDGHHPESDTRQALVDLVRLRSERAQLLGFESHAHYVIAENTAGSPDRVLGLLSQAVAPAIAKAETEAAELTTLLQQDHPGATLEAWDWAYYAAKAASEALSLDSSELTPYLELDSVIERGVFHAAELLYGLTFTRRPDLHGYHKDVRVYEVSDEHGSRGLFLADYHARSSKRGGAWMNTLTDQSHLLGSTTIVLNNLNIAHSTPGEPTLLTWSEVETAFHEFGHALHAFLSDVRYPSVSGTAVPRDFVEFPSQVNEMWAYHPQILGRYARHHQTDEPLDPAVVQRLQDSRSQGQGYETTSYLGAALLDLQWHLLAPEDATIPAAEVLEREAAILSSWNLNLTLIPARYRSTYLNHSFGGGYDAGYYSYLWSEVLDADTVDLFTNQLDHEGDGGLNREAGQRFSSRLLSRGYSRPAMDSYLEFAGREPDPIHMLARRGLR